MTLQILISFLATSARYFESLTDEPACVCPEVACASALGIIGCRCARLTATVAAAAPAIPSRGMRARCTCIRSVQIASEQSDGS